MLQGFNRLYGPLLHFPVSPYLPCTGDKHSMCCFTSAEKMGSMASLSLLVVLLTVQLWIPFASLCQGHIVRFMVSSASSRIHRSFSLAQRVVAADVQDLTSPYEECSWVSHPPISPACQDQSGWWHKSLLHQLLPSVLCPLQTWPIIFGLIIQLTNEDNEQGWTQYWPLGYITSYLSPSRLCAITFLGPPVCPLILTITSWGFYGTQCQKVW